MIRIGFGLALACLVPMAATALDGREVRVLVEQALTAAGQGGQPVLSVHRAFPPPSGCAKDCTASGWLAGGEPEL